MRFSKLQSAEELVERVEELGFLPFFAHDIDGFSVEECCPVELWFAEDEDGPWEWKGPAARSGKCVYGKFFGGKAGFVSLDYGDAVLGDVPAKGLRYQTAGLNGDDIVITFWYTDGEDVYRIACSYAASAAALYEPIFLAIMESYTVTG